MNGGNGGDPFHAEGCQPVIDAAVAAADDQSVKDVLRTAGEAAAARTNANAARVADAILVAAKELGATTRPERLHSVTDAPLYGSLKKMSVHKWEAEGEQAAK